MLHINSDNPDNLLNYMQKFRYAKSFKKFDIHSEDFEHIIEFMQQFTHYHHNYRTIDDTKKIDVCIKLWKLQTETLNAIFKQLVKHDILHKVLHRLDNHEMSYVYKHLSTGVRKKVYLDFINALIPDYKPIFKNTDCFRIINAMIYSGQLYNFQELITHVYVDCICKLPIDDLVYSYLDYNDYKNKPKFMAKLLKDDNTYQFLNSYQREQHINQLKKLLQYSKTNESVLDYCIEYNIIDTDYVQTIKVLKNLSKH